MPKYKAAKGRFCSVGCYQRNGPWRPLVERPRNGRMVSRRNHPLASSAGVVRVSRLVLYEKIGPGSHPCHWCGKIVSWTREGLIPDALISDHLNWDRHDDRPENLVPACIVCNSHRTRTGGSALIRKEEPAVEVGRTRTRAIPRFCAECGTQFLAIPAALRKGRAQFCSRSCARRTVWKLKQH